MTHLLYNESAMISSQLKISGFTVTKSFPKNFQITMFFENIKSLLTTCMCSVFLQCINHVNQEITFNQALYGIFQF